MKLSTEIPHFRANSRSGGAWILRADLHGDFMAAWMAGKAFWSGFAASGGAITIKLADIVAVDVWDADEIAHDAAELEEKRSRKLTDGEA